MTTPSWCTASRLHLFLLVTWAALMVPTLTVWRDSIWWIGFISVYANIATHWGAYQAARAEVASKQIDDKEDT